MIMNYTDEFGFCKPHLMPGESILWKGTPGKGHLFTGHDVFMIPFSIMWCGFAIFWEAAALISNAPFVFKFCGIPFVCVGLYMVFGRFVWTAFIRKRTAYVITNKKIIRLRGNKIDILDSKNMPPMHVSVYKDGSGTIRFGQPDYYGRRNNLFDSNSGLFVLEDISDVEKVQQLIHNME